MTVGHGELAGDGGRPRHAVQTFKLETYLQKAVVFSWSRGLLGLLGFLGFPVVWYAEELQKSFRRSNRLGVRNAALAEGRSAGWEIVERVTDETASLLIGTKGSLCRRRLWLIIVVCSKVC